MELINQFVIPGILFLLTLAFGFWLSRAGKPYNGVLFNIHKLIALGGVVWAGIQFSKTFHVPDWQLVVLLAVSALWVIALFVSGALRERPSEDQRAVSHLRELMVSFGLEPAGNRGGWLQPVPLDIVEPTGAEPWVTLRPESEPPTGSIFLAGPEPDRGPEPDAEPSPDAGAELAAAPEGAAEAEAPPDGDGEAPDADESPPDIELPEPAREPGRAVELASLGAFRQRGAATPHRALLVGPIRTFETPFASERYAGRVALIRPPKGFNLQAAESPAEVDLLFAVLRDAGAVGCLLLTDGDDESIERFRELWQRQIRRGGPFDQTMLIEGVIGAEGRALLEQTRMRDEPWVLDVALATREFEIESHNVLGRITGRERPDEAVVLTCSWDTPDPATAELDSLRLLATIAAFHQLAEWSRRSTPPRYSLVLLLTANASFAAGQRVHAAWTGSAGAETAVLLALDRPTTEPAPAVTLSGHFDAATAELVRNVIASDGRDLILAEQLSMPSLAPYLRYPAPVMTVGAPAPGALEDRREGQESPLDADPRAGIHADVRLLRNLVLALAARRR